MIIRHSISFKLFTYGSNKEKSQIRMRVTFNSQRIEFGIGCVLYDTNFWDDEVGLVKSNYKDKKGNTTLSINNNIRLFKDQMESVFKYFEVNEIYPTIKQLKDRYNCKTKDSTPQAPKPANSVAEVKEPNFFKVYDEFMQQCGEKNAWTKATFQKMEAMRTDYLSFNKKLKFSDLTEKTLTEFVVYLRDKKKLKTPRKAKGDRKKYDKEDLIGLKNSTIKKKLGYMRWFLNWATDKGYNTKMDYKQFEPSLKSTQKKVIYLNKDELAKVYHLRLSPEHIYLEPIRDIFLFCCFSSLRYSDAIGLKWNDVKDDHIEVTTVKTADSLSIEVNDVMSEILKKYTPFKGKRSSVFPGITNQAMNRDLKILCKLSGIDSEERITTYKGNERKDEIKKKWELVGTHTGRRTFIVNALSQGISPSVVMKWTGHSDYASMKPYIDIVDSIKAKEMTKMNFFSK